MKITIVTGGSRGDVQPYVALGQGLRMAGHSVRLLASDDFAGMAQDAGLEFCSNGPSVEAMLQSPEWRKLTDSGNFIAILARMQSEMKKRGRESAMQLPALLEGADLLVAGPAGMGGAFSVAERLCIPTVIAHVYPLTPTRAFSAPIAPPLPFARHLNPASFQLLEQLLWQTVRSSDAIVRKELRMPSAPFAMPFASLQQGRVAVLYGFSRHVVPRPDDWGTHCHVTGYWFLDRKTEGTLPDDLLAFVRAGEPPVLIGFGSMGNRNPEATTRLAIEALRKAGKRGILVAGWGGLSSADLPDTVHLVATVPYGPLLPHLSAMVHHGGAGTTAAGLRAGLPTVVVPFFGDQPFWGRRVAQIGAGPAPIPRQRLTAENLAAAITECVTDLQIRQRAARIGECLRAENGVARAVGLIEQYAALLAT